MFDRLTIRTRLTGTIALLALLMLFLGARGIFELRKSNEILKYVYGNSMVSMKAIYESQIQLDRARLSLDRVALDLDNPASQEPLKKAQDFIDGNEKFWKSYWPCRSGRVRRNWPTRRKPTVRR
jgi:hypothetical protein